MNTFKQANVLHTFIINDLVVDYNIKDPKEMREKAKRKGKIIREIDADGNKKVKEKNFEV